MDNSQSQKLQQMLDNGLLMLAFQRQQLVPGIETLSDDEKDSAFGDISMGVASSGMVTLFFSLLDVHVTMTNQSREEALDGLREYLLDKRYNS